MDVVKAIDSLKDLATKPRLLRSFLAAFLIIIGALVIICAPVTLWKTPAEKAWHYYFFPWALLVAGLMLMGVGLYNYRGSRDSSVPAGCEDIGSPAIPLPGSFVAYGIDIRLYSHICSSQIQKGHTTAIFTVLEFSPETLVDAVAGHKKKSRPDLASYLKDHPTEMNSLPLEHLIAFRKAHDEDHVPITRVILAREATVEEWFAQHGEVYDAFMLLNGGVDCYLGFYQELCKTQHGLCPFLSDHAVFMTREKVTLVDYFTDSELLETENGNILVASAAADSESGKRLVGFLEHLRREKNSPGLYYNLARGRPAAAHT